MPNLLGGGILASAATLGKTTRPHRDIDSATSVPLIVRTTSLEAAAKCPKYQIVDLEVAHAKIKFCHGPRFAFRGTQLAAPIQKPSSVT
jgi:hypothetical protein